MTELKILSAGAVKRGVAQMADAFSREQGRPVTVEFATAPELRKRVAAGERPDVLVAPPGVMDELAKAGTIVGESRRFIGRSRVGIVVHATSPIKDVPDVDAFTQALVAATAVVHNNASSGIYCAKLLENMGLTATLGSRVVVVEGGAAIMHYVADHPPGAIGLAQISEIRVLMDKGLPIRLAGPLPDAVQNITSYEAAAVAGRAEESAAKALANFMATPEAKTVFAATGID